MAKRFKFRQIEKILKNYDGRFEFVKNRGKGSERMIYHPNIGGRSKSLPVKCHGLGAEVLPYVIADIVRRFSVPRSLFFPKAKGDSGAETSDQPRKETFSAIDPPLSHEIVKKKKKKKKKVGTPKKRRKKK